MRNLNKDFENKKIEKEKLLKYGFVLKNGIYVYETYICNCQFQVVVEITKENQTAKVIDLELGDEYILADVFGAKGNFVGKVKEEYEKILRDILNNCTAYDVFKSQQALEIIKYVKEKYNDDLEYLWKKFPSNAVWRNKENQKWFGILLLLNENKLGIESDRVIEIIDLRYPKESIKEIIDNQKVFAGYHMNKNSWITIRLDGSVPINKIYELIDNSYTISLK